MCSLRFYEFFTEILFFHPLRHSIHIYSGMILTANTKWPSYVLNPKLEIQIVAFFKRKYKGQVFQKSLFQWSLFLLPFSRLWWCFLCLFLLSFSCLFFKGIFLFLVDCKPYVERWAWMGNISIDYLFFSLQVAGSLSLDLNEPGVLAEPYETDDRRFVFHVSSPKLRK